MITVIGSGYVGLVAAACLSQYYEIICLDINKKKIECLNNGLIPIYEPGLDQLIQQGIANKRLQFTDNYEKALAHSSMAIIAVDTPMGNNGTCDLTNIRACANSIGKILHHTIPIVIKSTVPVGTAHIMHSILTQLLEQRNIDSCIDVISNPEFLREGSAIKDFMEPDRIILGVPNKRAEKIMRELYRPFNHSQETFIIMSPESSELTKYASNTMLACRISFMNNISQLCEKTGADICSIEQGLSADKRIGPEFLRAGIGYGGSCFPKDVRALISAAHQYGVHTQLFESIVSVNETQKHVLFAKIASYFQERGSLHQKHIAVLGLAFKPGTDDMREASSIPLIRALTQAGAHVYVFDPVAMDAAKTIFSELPHITWCANEWHAIENADALVLATEWNQFIHLDLTHVLQKMRGCAFFDGRNQYEPQDMAQLGFDYISIGRKPWYGSVHIVEKRVANAQPEHVIRT